MQKPHVKPDKWGFAGFYFNNFIIYPLKMSGVARTFLNYEMKFFQQPRSYCKFGVVDMYQI